MAETHSRTLLIGANYSSRNNYHMKKLSKIIALSLILSSFLLSYSLAGVPSPPEQPLDGPGGATYEHEDVAVTGPYWPDALGVNETYKYFLFKPVDPTPDEAPVVLFLHGWGAVSLKHYDIWIRHIVRKGYIVVWVQYQRDDVVETPKMSLTWRFDRKILVMWRDALKRLDD